MASPRTVRLSCLRPTNTVCVVGTQLLLDVYGCVPPGAVSFEVKRTAGVQATYRHRMVQTEASRNRWPLDSGVEVLVSMDYSSDSLNDNKISVSYYGSEKKDTPLAKARLYFTGVVVSLDVDTSRDGKVNLNRSEQASWTWGSKGQGAILLVNCDREEKCICSGGQDTFNTADLADMSVMYVTTKGPRAAFETHDVVLHITPAEADKVYVYHAIATESMIRLKHALGDEKLVYKVPLTSPQKNMFFVEGITFPDAGFSGLVSIGVTLMDSSVENIPEVPIFTRNVIFRMTPWIMTPNTLKPVEVFVCSTADNNTFLGELTELVKRAKCKLTICPKVENRGDRWMQDEMEFGYIEDPRKNFPVVLDSPRNRELDVFPFKCLLGPDFGYWTREPEDESEVNSLDSFGNLEVSPPVTVNGKEYPLGRIIFGGTLPTFYGRRMTKVVRDFLYAQQVQSPVELYSDWLIVGHVDEFMTFVPAPSEKGFCLLLASPMACCTLFEEKLKDGHGDALMFKDLDTHQMTIKEILEDKYLIEQNTYVQGCIDWNRGILKKELGLEEKDIIDIPVLFYIPPKDYRAVAFFPDMVNMIVLGKLLGIPKPFGPIINGKCCLEEKVCSLLEPLGLNCTFIDDFSSYHENLGEVHCGTNVRREPFAFKWWNMVA
ncbi:protein-arginine deiminase type-3-like isoform X2 [Ambystoma mexicanum]|uniref:protein-arginine deiminase type-3-like isoform X2 n=1 Tax=Ambystoma mexicanum TaxID=8296 RepID=UPI0037E7DB9B